MKEDESIRLEMHPETWFTLEDAMFESHGMPMHACSGEKQAYVFGIPVRINYNLRPAGIVEKWIPPKERFVTYEESDEGWCRFCGIGSVRRVVDCGDIRICRDLPEFQIAPGYGVRYQWATLDERVDRVGYECFDDPEYINAVKAKAIIEKKIRYYLSRKLDKGVNV